MNGNDFDSSVDNHQVVGYSGKIVLDGNGMDNNPAAMHKVTSLLRKNGLDLAEMIESPPTGATKATTSMVGIAHAYEPLAKGFNPHKIMRELEAIGKSVNCSIAMTEA